MAILRYIWFLLIFTDAINVFAENEQLFFRQITTENGLHHNYIYAINQDQFGYLWFATENGLHRYNGIDFKVFMHDENDKTSLSDNAVYRLLRDKNNNYWVCTNSGLDKYDFNTGNFEHIAMEFYENSVLKWTYLIYVPEIIEDNNGNIYLSGNNSVYKFNSEIKRLQEVRITDSQGNGIPVGVVTSMFVDSKNRIWFGSRTHGLFCFENKTNGTNTFKNTTKCSNIGSEFILSINEDKWGRIFVGTAQGLYFQNKETSGFKQYTAEQSGVNPLSHNIVWGINKDKNNDLWLSTNGGGLYKLLNEKLEFACYRNNTYDNSSINDNSVQCFFEDIQHNYWIGTQHGGVNYCINNNASVFKVLQNDKLKKESLSNNSIAAITEDKNSNLYMGTDGGGLNYYNFKTNSYSYFNKGNVGKAPTSKESIMALLIDSNNNLWAGGYLSGLMKIPEGHKPPSYYFNDPIKENSIGCDDIRCVFEDSKNNIWVATNGGGLNLLNKKSNTFTRFNINSQPYPLCSNYTLTLFEDNVGYLWVGSYNAISRINLSNMHIDKYDQKDSVKGNWVYTFLQDTNGNIWIGTNMGLSYFDYSTKKFSDMTEKVGINYNIVCGLLEDSKGNIWISTYNGLVRYNIKSGISSTYYKYDGLPGNYFYRGAYYKGKNGTLYFGTTSGLVYFDPLKIKNNSYVPPVYIEKIEANNNVIPKEKLRTGTVSLKYSEASVLNIHYVGLNYINPEKNQYSIKMEGLDENWRNMGNSLSTTYTNMNPGSYIFHVKASNNDNVWNEKGASLYIIVIPPIWKTYWAYSFYVLLFAFLVYYLWSQTLIRLRYRKDMEIEHLKAEKAEEISKMKTDFFINVSHELSTPLTLILPPVETMISRQTFDSKLMNLVRNNAQLLLRLVNELIDLQKVEERKVSINLTKGDIVNFTRQIANNFIELATTKEITLNFESGLELLYFDFDVEKMEKILYNIFSNAVKYTPSKGTIDVKIELLDSKDNSINQTLCIAVTDSGVGISEEDQKLIFDRYYRVRNEKKEERLHRAAGFGLGLNLTSNLVEMHNGKIEVKSMTGKGSCFSLLFPYRTPVDRENAQTFAECGVIELLQDYTIPLENDLEIDDTCKAGKKYTILIIEDSIGVCEMIRILLSDKYHLHFAHNGLQGFKMAVKTQPNLIVTDIMMPEMDGIEFCKKVKSDFYTSHIPVIMLTALNSSEYMIKGLSTGADDYISKPFNPDIFALRVKNIIESRISLQKRYLADTKYSPSDIALTSADDTFITKTIAVIEKHLESPDFDVNLLASDLNMSTITLYRKLKSLTGQSINQFIRTIRLKRAAQLLESKTLLVQDVATMVGFSDIKYFRQCFFRQFGMNPSDYNITSGI